MASVLVTGASRGIGLATCLSLGRAGHTVFATMRNPAKAPALAAAAKAESLPIRVSAMDVDSDQSVKDAIEAIITKNGPLDVLVNNAGIERRGSVEELDIKEFRAVMETNYFGPIRCIQAVLPGMRKRRKGCIVNIASVAGHIAGTPLASYAASKFAFEALSEALAQEVMQFGIRVAVVEPGIINTDMAQAISSEPEASVYPQVRRFAGLFTASLANPSGPELVAEKILEIIDSDTRKLRYPVGPDAQPFLDWRASMSDEQWTEWWAADDDAWYAAVERDFGLNARTGR